MKEDALMKSIKTLVWAQRAYKFLLSLMSVWDWGQLEQVAQEKPIIRVLI